MGKRAEKSSLFPAGCQENGTGLNFAGAAAVASCPFDSIYYTFQEKGTLFLFSDLFFIGLFRYTVCYSLIA